MHCVQLYAKTEQGARYFDLLEQGIKTARISCLSDMLLDEVVQHFTQLAVLMSFEETKKPDGVPGPMARLESILLALDPERTNYKKV